MGSKQKNSRETAGTQKKRRQEGAPLLPPRPSGLGIYTKSGECLPQPAQTGAAARFYCKKRIALAE
jgi:hypothetical protein